MRVLMISADRSKRGILYRGTPAFKRQEAYAEQFGHLDIIGFSRRSDGAKHVDVGALHLYPTNSTSRLLYSWSALRMALRLPRPDVVSAQDPFETGLTGWFIARVRGVPLHVQVHTDLFSPEYARLSFLNSIRVLLARFVLRRAARVRVVSERVRLGIENELSLQIPVTVLPIFVDAERFRYRLPDVALAARFRSFSSRVLVVSRLEAEKDIETAIKLFSEYAPLTACLVVVGEGSMREFLEGLSKTLRIQHRIYFEEAEDIAAYYKFADLVLCTSKYEGYGLVIAEALAAGKPVLSRDVGAARELGAMVASSYEELGQRMIEWFQHGSREGRLSTHPYKNFDDYVRAYCDDIAACVKER